MSRHSRDIKKNGENGRKGKRRRKDWDWGLQSWWGGFGANQAKG